MTTYTLATVHPGLDSSDTTPVREGTMPDDIAQALLDLLTFLESPGERALFVLYIGDTLVVPPMSLDLNMILRSIDAQLDAQKSP